MNTLQETALKAAQGQDTQDFLDHIAWKEVILPKLMKTKEQLTTQLVGSVLSTPDFKTITDTKEQIAGRIQGIDFVIALIQKIVNEGLQAREVLNRNNISIT